MPKQAVTYSPSTLTFSLVTSDPAATHASLLQGLLSGLSYAVEAPQKPKSFAEEMLPVIELIKAISPGETELKKMYEG